MQQTQSVQSRDLNTGQAYTITPTAEPPPKEWIDKDTGHRVIRLSDEPNTQSLYFHQYSFSPDGKKLVFTSPTGIYQVDLQTREKSSRSSRPNPRQIATKAATTSSRSAAKPATSSSPARSPAMPRRKLPAPPSRRIAAPHERSVWWIDPATKEEHQIGKLPANYNVGTVNCDETLLAGAVTYLDGRNGAATQPVTAAPGQRINLQARWAQHLPMALITMDAKPAN